MSTDGLSAPGASQYDSSTMYVGDGTWDSNDNTFLLPNLMGLNFATMRYNGMGNRFRELTEYHSLILGHGICAFLVFGALVPSAIFIAKYMHQDRQLALKLHINLQIMNVLLLTVVIILGFIAVGPPRSLTNPHHGIGLALYVCVLAQFLYGAWAHKREKKRKEIPLKEPKKFYIHKLFGRAIALLGFVQIALGLTLYGSPEYLFILYALVGAFLLTLYLVLDYRYKPGSGGGGGQPEFYSEYGSYVSGDQTDLTESRPPREEEGKKHHWLRDAAILGGGFAAYEGWKHRRQRRREERLGADGGPAETDYMSQSQGPSGATWQGGPNRPGPAGPPGPGYGPAYGPSGPGYPPMTPQRQRQQSRTRMSGPHNRMSPESWDDEKSEVPQQRHTWRDRILGAGAGIATFEGVKSIFNRRRRRDEDSYVQDNRYHRPGSPSVMTQTDVSRVEQGQAPYSPHDDPRRTDMTGASTTTPVGPAPGASTAFTPGQDSAGGRRTDYDADNYTPSRAPRRPRPRLSQDSYDNEGRASLDDEPPKRDSGHTLRDSIAALGAIKGFQEWNKRRKERKDRQRIDQLRQQELDDERFQRRTSGRYPNAADGRRPSGSETVMTGMTQSQGNPTGQYGMGGSNPELSRTNFGSRPDVNAPPLPLAAGQLPGSSVRPGGVGASNSSRQNPQDQGYHIPPPPAGPPPGNDGLPGPPPGPPPGPGSLQMPAGAIQPDPSRLYSRERLETTNQQASSSQMEPSTAAGAAHAAGLAATAAAAGRVTEQSPTRYKPSRDGSRTRFADPPSTTFGSSAVGRRPSITSGSQSQSQSQSQQTAAVGDTVNSPPLSVKMKMHSDGRHVTLRRLNEDEAAVERQARRAERRQRRRRTSSLSSGMESGGDSSRPPRANSSRFRRNNNNNGAAAETGGIRPSSSQPFGSVPPPPPGAMSNPALNRPPSELNLPPAQPPRLPQHSAATLTPQQQMSPPQGPLGIGSAASPPANPNVVGGSGLSHSYGSPGEAGTGTDLSTFAADNRKRRRAERARRLQAEGRGVEFE